MINQIERQIHYRAPRRRRHGPPGFPPHSLPQRSSDFCDNGYRTGASQCDAHHAESMLAHPGAPCMLA